MANASEEGYCQTTVWTRRWILGRACNCHVESSTSSWSQQKRCVLQAKGRRTAARRLEQQRRRRMSTSSYHSSCFRWCPIVCNSSLGSLSSGDLSWSSVGLARAAELLESERRVSLQSSRARAGSASTHSCVAIRSLEAAQASCESTSGERRVKSRRTTVAEARARCLFVSYTGVIVDLAAENSQYTVRCSFCLLLVALQVDPALRRALRRTRLSFLLLSAHLTTQSVLHRLAIASSTPIYTIALVLWNNWSTI